MSSEHSKSISAPSVLPTTLWPFGVYGSSGTSVIVVVDLGVVTGVRYVMKVVTTVGVGPPTLIVLVLVLVVMGLSPTG